MNNTNGIKLYLIKLEAFIYNYPIVKYEDIAIQTYLISITSDIDKAKEIKNNFNNIKQIRMYNNEIILPIKCDINTIQ